MRPILLRAIASAMLLASLAPAAHAGALTDEFIVGGDPVADDNAWPWQVRIFASEEHGAGFCGGSLIAPDWVLTAGHCMLNDDGSVSPVFVGYGSVFQSKQTLIASEAVFVHPDYPARDTDVALIKLSEPVPHARVIALATPETAPAVTGEGAKAMATGWGAVWDFNNFAEALEIERDVVSTRVLLDKNQLLDPDQMRQVELTLISATECRESYEAFWEATGNSGYTIARSEICAGAPEGAKGSCFGDSGGPLMAPADTDTGYLQVGVVSWGVQCGNPALPGVYARVSYLYDWISKTMAAN